MVGAIPWAIIHHRAFTAFTKGLRVNHSNLVSQWEEQVSVWELNPHDASIPCPFDLPDSGNTPYFPKLLIHISHQFTQNKPLQS